jgi:hypothetical protein
VATFGVATLVATVTRQIGDLMWPHYGQVTDWSFAIALVAGTAFWIRWGWRLQRGIYEADEQDHAVPDVALPSPVESGHPDGRGPSRAA